MKRFIVILLLSLVSFAVIGQKRIRDLSTQPTANNGYYIAVDHSSFSQTKKMTIETANSLEATIRAADDDTIEASCGLNGDGTYTANAGTNFLTAGDFAALSLTPNLYNADFILDSILNANVLGCFDSVTICSGGYINSENDVIRIDFGTSGSEYYELTTDGGTKVTSWTRVTEDSITFNTDSLIIRIQSADGSLTTSDSTAFTIRDGNDRSIFMMKTHGGIAIGWDAGNNDNGADLLAIGYEAAKNLQFVAGGHNTVFLGAHAGRAVTTGTDNVYIGENAGRDDQTATFNTYVGQGSGLGTLGSVSEFNTAVGGQSFSRGTTGDKNSFFGYLSGDRVTSGSNNAGFGNGAGGYQNDATGDNNASFGYLTGRDLKAGANNSFFGGSSANTLEDGNNNAWFGYNTGNGIVTGSGSVLIGYNVGSNIGDAGASNMLMIDNSNTNTPLIEGDFSTDDVIINGALEVTEDIKQEVHTDDVSNPPTDAELDAIFGTPATVGTGFKALIDDNGAGTAFYTVVSDGTNWWIFTGTKAL